MKKINLKFLSIFLLMAVSIALLLSCEKKEGRTIEVWSTYPGLTELMEGEYDKEYVSSLYFIDNKYNLYSCFVSVQNDKLCVTGYDGGSHNTAENVCYPVSPGVFVSYSFYGDGWVTFVDDKDGPTNPQLILKAQCIAILQPELSENFYYFVTDNSTDVDDLDNLDNPGRSIYQVHYDTEKKEMIVEKLTQLDFSPLMAILSEDKKTIYVIPYSFIVEEGEDTEIIAYDIETNTTETYYISEFFSHSCVNSIVEYEGKLYIGARAGIWEFDPQTKTTVWYPVNYDEILK